MKIHQRIKHARKTRNMTQKDLAVAVGCTPTAIAHFESERRRPSLANLVRLCDALAVSADWMAGTKLGVLPEGFYPAEETPEAESPY